MCQFSNMSVFITTKPSMEFFFCAKYDVTLTSEFSKTSQNLTQHFRKIQGKLQPYIPLHFTHLK